LRDAIGCIPIQGSERREEYADEEPQDAEEEKANPQGLALSISALLPFRFLLS